MDDIVTTVEKKQKNASSKEEAEGRNFLKKCLTHAQNFSVGLSSGGVGGQKVISSMLGNKKQPFLGMA